MAKILMNFRLEESERDRWKEAVTLVQLAHPDASIRSVSDMIRFAVNKTVEEAESARADSEAA